MSSSPPFLYYGVPCFDYQFFILQFLKIVFHLTLSSELIGILPFVSAHGWVDGCYEFSPSLGRSSYFLSCTSCIFFNCLFIHVFAFLSPTHIFGFLLVCYILQVSVLYMSLKQFNYCFISSIYSAPLHSSPYPTHFLPPHTSNISSAGVCVLQS